MYLLNSVVLLAVDHARLIGHRDEDEEEDEEEDDDDNDDDDDDDDEDNDEGDDDDDDEYYRKYDDDANDPITGNFLVLLSEEISRGCLSILMIIADD